MLGYFIDLNVNDSSMNSGIDINAIKIILLEKNDEKENTNATEMLKGCWHKV